VLPSQTRAPVTNASHKSQMGVWGTKLMVKSERIGISLSDMVYMDINMWPIEYEDSMVRSLLVCVHIIME
jgi:hypothetical protein